MPIILILLLALIIAQVGFWDALGSILGAIAMVVLFILLAVTAIAVGGYIVFRRIQRRF